MCEVKSPRYLVVKASGSRYAYVTDSLKGRVIKKYDVLKGRDWANGWNIAKRHADRLNAETAKEAPHA